jgi:hypothetical protein
MINSLIVAAFLVIQGPPLFSGRAGVILPAGRCELWLGF